jgi:exopolyphosphatase/guanosine-5'-triphosphate,3'-diphosphate pyrophosphatase
VVQNSPVAVIDIGSNSIKALVAERATDGSLRSLAAKTLDARISAGLSRADPRLSDEGMNRGVAAIRELLDFVAPFSPSALSLVATSAVRDASNGGEFRQRVRTATGHAVSILSGVEEANLIGRGLTCDPALTALKNFYVFDLGGGSLECLAFRDRRIEQAVSLQLGCVRLTEAFVRDPDAAIPFGVIAAVEKLTAASVQGRFAFSLPDATAVGTGGTVTTARAILAARNGQTLEASPPRIEVAQLQSLCDELAAIPLAERKKITGLPPGRADVFPTALATLLAVAKTGGFQAYHHSLYNLRFGIAAELLAT